MSLSLMLDCWVTMDGRHKDFPPTPSQELDGQVAYDHQCLNLNTACVCKAFEQNMNRTHSDASLP